MTRNLRKTIVRVAFLLLVTSVTVTLDNKMLSCYEPISVLQSTLSHQTQ